MCFLWCYALQIRSLKHAEIIIDILQLSNAADVSKELLEQLKEHNNLEETEAVELTNKLIGLSYQGVKRVHS